jgi:hypothetical protein
MQDAMVDRLLEGARRIGVKIGDPFWTQYPVLRASGAPAAERSWSESGRNATLAD